MDRFYTLSVWGLGFNNRANSCRNFACFIDLSTSSVDFEFVESMSESFWRFSSFVVVLVVDDTFADDVRVSSSTVLCDTGSIIANGFLSRLSKENF